jgi:protein phosphatase
MMGDGNLEETDIPLDLTLDEMNSTVKRNTNAGGSLAAFGMTDVGRRRQSNQDQFLIANLIKSLLVTSTNVSRESQSRLFGEVQGQLLLVADGMGGHAAGERASSLAIEHLVGQLLHSVNWFPNAKNSNEVEFVERLKNLLLDAHMRILNESSRNIDHRGMGTTLTMAHIVWPNLYVLHAGDSRCYLVRQGQVEQLTTDHTLARRLVEAGGLRPEDEATSQWSHVLWNVLGGRGEGELIAEVRRIELQPNDYIVVCSDGLHRYLEAHQLSMIVNSFETPEMICTELVRMANEKGGEDNITVIVAKQLPPTDDPLDGSSELEDTHPAIEAPPAS